jgi:hypothetical protein
MGSNLAESLSTLDLRRGDGDGDLPFSASSAGGMPLKETDFPIKRSRPQLSGIGLLNSVILIMFYIDGWMDGWKRNRMDQLLGSKYAGSPGNDGNND